MATLALLFCFIGCDKQPEEIEPIPYASNTPEPAQNTEEIEVAEEPPDVPDIPETPPIETPLDNPKIVVWKADRRLELYDGDELVKSYRTGLGFAPEGNKYEQGDGRTPEGEYYVCVKNPNSRFYLSLGISYPNEKDANGGLRRGIISRDEYDRIIYEIERRRKPPWNTALGGEICIHGYGSQSDWTLGCIALDNGDIEELYEIASMGTEVVINP